MLPKLVLLIPLIPLILLKLLMLLVRRGFGGVTGIDQSRRGRPRPRRLGGDRDGRPTAKDGPGPGVGDLEGALLVAKGTVPDEKSHRTSNWMQLAHDGLASSHLILRRLHVKQPLRDLRWARRVPFGGAPDGPAASTGLLAEYSEDMELSVTALRARPTDLFR